MLRSFAGVAGRQAFDHSCFLLAEPRPEKFKCPATPHDMRIGRIIALFGAVMTALAGVGYWQMTRMATSFAGRPSPVDLQKTSKTAIVLICVGVLLVIVGTAVEIFGRDEDE